MPPEKQAEFVQFDPGKFDTNSPWAKEIIALEEQITGGEKESMRIRWEFGKRLITEREGKKFPKGLLDSMAGLNLFPAPPAPVMRPSFKGYEG
jgi:hypothetical protein